MIGTVTKRAEHQGMAVHVEVACPLCESTEYSVYVWAPSHYGPEKRRVTRCSSCGMIFTNPQSAVYEDAVQSRGVLDRHFVPASIEHSRQTARLQLSIIRRLTGGSRLLDFGCGEGAFVHEAIQLGWDAAGLDLNEELVCAANKYWKYSALHAGTLEAFATGQTEFFDAIVCNQVFEHLRKPLPVAKLLGTLLKPRGILFIDVPNALQPAERFRRGSTLDPTSHWNHFTVSTLSAMMVEAGYQVLYRSAAPSLVGLFHRMGMKSMCYRLGRLCKRLLPSVGTGVCVIGRKS